MKTKEFFSSWENILGIIFFGFMAFLIAYFNYNNYKVIKYKNEASKYSEVFLKSFPDSLDIMPKLIDDNENIYDEVDFTHFDGLFVVLSQGIVNNQARYALRGYPIEKSPDDSIKYVIVYRYKEYRTETYNVHSYSKSPSSGRTNEYHGVQTISSYVIMAHVYSTVTHKCLQKIYFTPPHLPLHYSNEMPKTASDGNFYNWINYSFEKRKSILFEPEDDSKANLFIVNIFCSTIIPEDK
jgi:hypothetical protein